MAVRGAIDGGTHVQCPHAPPASSTNAVMAAARIVARSVDDDDKLIANRTARHTKQAVASGNTPRRARLSSSHGRLDRSRAADLVFMVRGRRADTVQRQRKHRPA